MKVTYDQLGDHANEDASVVHIISDSLGESAQSVVLSAAAQFEPGTLRFVKLSKITGVECVREYLDEHEDEFTKTAVFHSIVDPELRRQVRDELNQRGITSVDIQGPSIQLLAGLTGQTPKNRVEERHQIDARYIRRVEAMEWCMAHGEGQNPQDLPKADIVLVGLTGSAKMPLAMHLSFLGYKVSTVPLDAGAKVPDEISQVEPKRIFGLLTTSGVIAESRKRRLAGKGAAEGPSVDLTQIEDELRSATEAMRALGCTTLNVLNKTVEELSGDVLAQIEAK